MRESNRVKIPVLLALLATLVALCSIAATTFAQEESELIEARISARPLSDGRIEFAFQLQDRDALAGDEGQIVWQERILPRGRNFPDEPSIGVWLSSRPPSLVGQVETRIRAQRL